MDNILKRAKEADRILKRCNQLIDEIEFLLEDIPFSVSVQVDNFDHDDIALYWCTKEKYVMYEDSRVKIPFSCTKHYCKIVCFPYLEKLLDLAKEKLRTIRTRE